ncbi:MAG: serine hydrolase [Thermonemataceae bacterium]
MRVVIIITLVLLTKTNVFGQIADDHAIYKEIMTVDSLLFEEAFNKCKVDVLNEIVATDVEFYHDQSGTTYGQEKFIQGIKKNICTRSYRPSRKLLSSEIHLLQSNGSIYGALQNGIHEFYAQEENKAPYLTSTANFTHLWIKKEDRWLLKRVLSYNHQTPNEKKETTTRILLTSSPSIENWLKENKVPALGVALLKNRALQQVVVYGELEKGVPAPYDAIFNVASLTKPIVTMLTLKLVENGNWDLDQPLYNYWVDPDVSSDRRSKQLTTRHILSHQSGFKNWRSANESGRLTFDFEPGSAFRYSGEGFEYLKKALEAKFNTKLELLVDSLIFKPLKMDNTFFYWTEAIDANRFAKWHDEEGSNSYKTYKNSAASAADDLLTTIEDYGRFAEHVLRGAALSDSLFKQMVTQQNGAKNSIKMGLGWELLPKLKNDEYALLHTGGDKGVNTLIMLLPKTGEGIVIFTNGDNGKNLFFKLIEDNLSLGKQIVGKAE